MSMRYQCLQQNHKFNWGYLCNEASLFPVIAKSGADRRGKIPDISLIAGKEFRNWLVRDSDPLFPGCPDRQKETP
ncbi:hypothetical protein TNCV_1554711 [Trichonephila clavipes]|nr:hypothetical protein TNCV_1554711 [Trichonephila clavipes]